MKHFYLFLITTIFLSFWNTAATAQTEDAKYISILNNQLETYALNLMNPNLPAEERQKTENIYLATKLELQNLGQNQHALSLAIPSEKAAYIRSLHLLLNTDLHENSQDFQMQVEDFKKMKPKGDLKQEQVWASQYLSATEYEIWKQFYAKYAHLF